MLLCKIGQSQIVKGPPNHDQQGVQALRSLKNKGPTGTTDALCAVRRYTGSRVENIWKSKKHVPSLAKMHSRDVRGLN